MAAQLYVLLVCCASVEADPPIFLGVPINEALPLVAATGLERKRTHIDRQHHIKGTAFREACRSAYLEIAAEFDGMVAGLCRNSHRLAVGIQQP